METLVTCILWSHLDPDAKRRFPAIARSNRP